MAVRISLQISNLLQHLEIHRYLATQVHQLHSLAVSRIQRLRFTVLGGTALSHYQSLLPNYHFVKCLSALYKCPF